ncbi:MAG: nuclear transport factor 2 family protein [Planctomycetota bacterium]|jgi:putative hydrolase of HD superfamily
MSPRFDPVALAQGQLDAYNAHDVESFAAFYAEDVTLRRLPGQEVVLEGREALRRHYDELFSREPDLRVELVARIPCGDWVMDHERVLRAPDADPVQTVAIYETANGVIRNVWFLPVTGAPPDA